MSSLSFERTIAAPPETVFGYFTDPTRFVTWMGVGADLSPEPGGTLRIENVDGSVTIGAFTRVVAPSLVEFTWGFEGHPDLPPGSSTVRVTLDAVDEGTLLRLVHDGLPTPALREAHSQGWELFLGRLGIAAIGGEPGPIPTGDA